MRFFIIPIAFAAAFDCFAQTAPTLGNVAASGIDMNTSTGGFITEISAGEVKEKGSVYLLETWTPMNVTLNGKLYKNIWMNYNLHMNRFEFMEGGKIKSVQSRIDYVTDDLHNKYFESVNLKLGNDAPPVFGICRQSQPDQQWNLVSYFSLLTIEPNYNQAMDVGEKSRTFSKKETFAIVSNGVLYPIITNKKKFAEQFSGKLSSIVAEFIKANKTNFKSESSILELIKYLNEKKL